MLGELVGGELVEGCPEAPVVLSALGLQAVARLASSMPMSKVTIAFFIGHANPPSRIVNGTAGRFQDGPI